MDIEKSYEAIRVQKFSMVDRVVKVMVKLGIFSLFFRKIK